MSDRLLRYNIDPGSIELHCLAGGLTPRQAHLVLANVHSMLGYGYPEAMCVCWSPTPQRVDDDGELFDGGQGRSHAWRVHYPDMRGRLSHNGSFAKPPPPGSYVAILVLRFDNAGRRTVEMLPFTMEALDHAAG